MTTKDLKRHASDALFVLDACNLSGVAFSFAKAMQFICDTVDSGTADRNQHPIAVLYATKIAELTGVAPIADEYVFSEAYQACKQMAGEP